jgi:hypothetical protein
VRKLSTGSTSAYLLCTSVIASHPSVDLRRIKGLDRELQNFANAVRQLGSSVGLVSSAYHLRARLNQVLHLFRENAVELFDKVKKENVEPVKPFTLRKRNKSRQLPTTKVRPSIPLHSDPEMLPKELKHLATDLTTFLKCLNDIPEFTDEAVNASVLSFEGDLKVGAVFGTYSTFNSHFCRIQYWASSLTEFEGDFRLSRFTFPLLTLSSRPIPVPCGGRLRERSHS